MSGRYDKTVINMGLVKEDDLKHPFKIRVCRDRTLTVTHKDEKPFNKVPISVYSVPTLTEANSLIMVSGKKQYTDHPSLPGKSWMKIFDEVPGSYHDLEYEDLPNITTKLKKVHEWMNRPR